jgi:Adenylate cyclase, family 3 (some proteins contain HAMP domain)
LPSHRYAVATIAQSDLVGFTQFSSSRQPQEVVEFISEIFNKFDVLTDKYDIYKVETVGDAYIGGQADPPLTATSQALERI